MATLMLVSFIACLVLMLVQVLIQNGPDGQRLAVSLVVFATLTVATAVAFTP